MAWVTPVTDRTAEDVQYAKTIQSSSTEELKGALSYMALNRIEGNTIVISDLLNEYGYASSIETKTDWARTDFLEIAALNRIQGNINTLQNSFVLMQELTDVNFTTAIEYDRINTIEELILETKNLLDGMVGGFNRLSFKLGTKRF